MCCPILLYLAIRGKLLLMKLKRAVRYEVVDHYDERFLQFYDIDGNPLSGDESYWIGDLDICNESIT